MDDSVLGPERDLEIADFEQRLGHQRSPRVRIVLSGREKQVSQGRRECS
jgi:hypothetical protein